MIILARYPIDTQPVPSSPLEAIQNELDAVAPPSIALHLFPVWPSSGDEGFAIDDWNPIRTELGSWESFERLAASRPVVLDAVLNHVGRAHEIIDDFRHAPDNNRELVFSYPIGTQGGPSSPRGGAVLRPIETDAGWRLVWGSFSPEQIDINLESPKVFARVRHYLAALKAHGVWGVRLDSVAYYKKDIREPQRHVAGVHALAAKVATEALAHDLYVYGQVDADSHGREYFNDEGHREIPKFDFAFPALLLYAIFNADPAVLAVHLRSIDAIGRPVVRSPRTHDGVLLRSGGLADALPRIRKMAADLDMVVRMEGGQPYELNQSLPTLVRLILAPTADESLYSALRMIVHLTAMASDDAYFYWPAILGYEPEKHARLPPSDDPRAWNRARMPAKWYQERLALEGAGLAAMLTLVSEIHDEHSPREYDVEGSLLYISRGRWRGVFNLSRSGSAPVEARWSTIVAQAGLTASDLAACGYVIGSV